MPKYLTRQSPGIKTRPTVQLVGEKYVHEYYHESNKQVRGGPAYKLEVGEECNRLLQLADELSTFSTSVWNSDTGITNGQMATNIYRIVDRVAESEELEAEPEGEYDDLYTPEVVARCKRCNGQRPECKTCKTFETPREAAAFMMGFRAAASDEIFVQIDPNEPQTVLVDCETDEAEGEWMSAVLEWKKLTGE